MTHANYCFLFDYDADERASHLADQAISAFEEYAEHFCDDNNGYDIGGCVTGDNEHFVVEWKGWPEDMQTFDAIRRYALGCVALDLGVDGASPYGFDEGQGAKLAELCFGDLMAKIMKTVPPRIARAYESFVRADDDMDRSFASYKRRKLVGQFEHLYAARVAPFSNNLETPYDYRCYDIRADSRKFDKSKSGILIVDIHT